VQCSQLQLLLHCFEGVEGLPVLPVMFLKNRASTAVKYTSQWYRNFTSIQQQMAQQQHAAQQSTVAMPLMLSSMQRQLALLQQPTLFPHQQLACAEQTSGRGTKASCCNRASCG